MNTQEYWRQLCEELDRLQQESMKHLPFLDGSSADNKKLAAFGAAMDAVNAHMKKMEEFKKIHSS